jgi:hypothetical protein
MHGLKPFVFVCSRFPRLPASTCALASFSAVNCSTCFFLLTLQKINQLFLTHTKDTHAHAIRAREAFLERAHLPLKRTLLSRESFCALSAFFFNKSCAWRIVSVHRCPIVRYEGLFALRETFSR